MRQQLTKQRSSSGFADAIDPLYSDQHLDSSPKTSGAYGQSRRELVHNANQRRRFGDAAESDLWGQKNQLIARQAEPTPCQCGILWV
jgi:hypothetical protein